MKNTPTGDVEAVTLTSILPDTPTCDTFDISILSKTPCITLFNIKQDDVEHLPTSDKSVFIPERTADVRYNLDVLIPAAYANVLYVSKTRQDRLMRNRIGDISPLIKAYYLGPRPAASDVEYLESDDFINHMEKYTVKFYTDLMTR